MRLPAGVVFGLAMATIILVAVVIDVALIAFRALHPWFGWMLP